MKKFILLIFLITGLFVYVSSKFSSVGNIFIVPEANYDSFSKSVRYGDMFRFARVNVFKEIIQYPEPLQNENKMQNADIIVIGDSFFETPINGERFPVNLEKNSGLKTFDPVRENNYSKDYPLAYLKNINYVKGEKKILIIESVERYVIERAINNYNQSNYNVKLADTKAIIKKIFSFDDLDNWLKFNIFASPIIEFKANLLFNYFNRINDNTPYYSVNPTFLFFKEDVEFSNSQKSQELIEQIAINIQSLSETLMNNYNIKLIFIVCPNKYSLYGKFAKQNYAYDMFISLLTKSLENKNVLSIDTYSLFSHSINDAPLYYNCDTHFNEHGRDILSNAIVNKIKTCMLRIQK